VAAGLLALAGFGAAVVWRSTRAMRSAAQEVRAEHEFRFMVQPFVTQQTGFEPISAPAVFRQAAQFGNHLYIAGPAGVEEYEANGSRAREFLPGRELPGSPVVALATAVLTDSRAPELLIATADAGVLAFDGRGFRQILPAAAEARQMNAILATASGHLLLGTSKRGVLVYDGKQLVEFHPTLDKLHVTALAGSDSDLWVGTIDRGVMHFHAGQTDSFSEGEGMPDPQVLSLAVAGDKAYVGTATGVAVFQDGRFSRVLAPGVLATALLPTATQLYVGTEDEGVLPIALGGRHPNPGVSSGQEVSGQEMAEVRQLFASGDAVYAVARDGLYRRNSHGLGWQRAFQPETAVLSDRNVSALATDQAGNLWVGYFDRGLDVLGPNGRVRHVEDEHVFCVNRILVNGKAGIVNVATANGLVRFDGDGSEQQVLTRADGLIADHVTDVANYRGGLALATPAGLTFLDSSGARSLYAFQGLVNNHVYALGVAGDELLAGTLGGISVLDRGDIAASFTTRNSELKHNWITAVAPLDSGWLIGTYGAGVLLLDPSGKFESVQKGTGNFEVNPNALLVTPELALAGTLGDGLYVLDRGSGRWTEIQDGLPSRNVTALAAANGYFYIGTDNGLVRIAADALKAKVRP
jgi:ligand-binding sensor domain-containing protein